METTQAVEFNSKACKKEISTLGFAFSAFQIIFIGAAYLLQFIIYKVSPSMLDSSLVAMLINYLPMYFIAVPVTAFIMNKIPKTTLEKKGMKISTYLLLLCIAWFFTIAGNLFGNILSMIIDAITGHTTTNALNEMMLTTNPLIILFFAIIMAPIVEEFICRKLIIDHTIQYGEWTAIIISGIVFGLLHGNLFQFFYAAILGMFMAYIYIKTGRLIYTIIFHFIINTLGSFVTIVLLNSMGINSTDSAELVKAFMEHIPQFILYFSYLLFEYGAALAGFILCIIFIKSFIVKIKPMNIPKGERIKCLLLNPGIIVFLIVTIADFASYFFLH